MLTHNAAFFDQKYSENHNIVILLQFKITIIMFYIIYIDGLQSSVSHDQWCSLIFCSEHTVIFSSLTRPKATPHKHFSLMCTVCIYM